MGTLADDPAELRLFLLALAAFLELPPWGFAAAGARMALELRGAEKDLPEVEREQVWRNRLHGLGVKSTRAAWLKGLLPRDWIAGRKQRAIEELFVRAQAAAYLRMKQSQRQSSGHTIYLGPPEPWEPEEAWLARLRQQAKTNLASSEARGERKQPVAKPLKRVAHDQHSAYSDHRNQEPSPRKQSLATDLSAVASETALSATVVSPDAEPVTLGVNSDQRGEQPFYSMRLVGNKIDDPSSPKTAREIAKAIFGKNDKAAAKRVREWMRAEKLPANLATKRHHYIVSQSAMEDLAKIYGGALSRSQE